MKSPVIHPRMEDRRVTYQLNTTYHVTVNYNNDTDDCY